MTKHVLVASPIELELNANGWIFNYDEYKKQWESGQRSRATMGSVKYPDGYDVLGNWDENGIPDYLLAESQELPSAFYSRCNAFVDLSEGVKRNLLEAYPELRATGSNDMVITKTTRLVATYFKFSSTSWKNMVAYYTYREGETVDFANIKKTILPVGGIKKSKHLHLKSCAYY